MLFDADGEPYASFGICQDITESKNREQELNDLLRRNAILYEALEASPIGVAVVTPEQRSRASSSMSTRNSNASPCTTLFPCAAAASRACDPRADAESGAGAPRCGRPCASSVSGAFELTCLRRDGGQFLAQIEIAPVRDHPGRDATVFVLHLRDITVDRQRTESLLQSQKMEALGQLSGGVAHEINNLLQPMLALSDLGQDIADTDPAKVRKYFEVIASSGRKARDVVRQVLTFARRDTVQLSHRIRSPP